MLFALLSFESILSGSDNTQYEGEWRANMRQGIGTALYEDGRYL